MQLRRQVSRTHPNFLQRHTHCFWNIVADQFFSNFINSSLSKTQGTIPWAKSDAKHRENWQLFALDQATQIDLQKFKARDYYRLLLLKKHQSLPTGPERWSKDFAIDREGRRGIFRVVPNLCKDSLPRRRS